MTYSREVLCVGECMIEMARRQDGLFQLSFGGDTFNTAVYLARAGVDTAYATALGDDPYSAAIVEIASKENIDTRLFELRAGRVPGLYLIETAPNGERSFFYWRDCSPARELFAPPSEHLVAAMTSSRMIYLSGVTLWLLGRRGRDNLFGALDAARAGGVQVVSDSNFRSRLWSDLDEARDAYSRLYARTDIALPTLEDESSLWGDSDARSAMARLAAYGIREIALKCGVDSALVVDTRGIIETVPVPNPVRAEDTTAAGDSFNAGYLAARIFGASIGDAAMAGHRLAAAVISHKGAIVPKEATYGALPVRQQPASPGQIARVP